MKKICDSTSDIISNLPGFILENILMCMPLRDAVRTSVLSKKWRYSWTLIPQLVFDDGILTIVPGENNLQISRNKLLVIISQALMLHRAPVLKFTLSIRELEGCPEIDNLITFLISNGIEELTLQFWKGELYKVPSSLLSCQQLKHLSLRFCKFAPPTTFEGFSRVVCLELREVFIFVDSLVSLISSCPVLKQLKLETAMTYDRLDIDSCSLERSYFVGNFKSICFKNAPRLAIVSLLSRGPVRELEMYKGDSFGWSEFLTNLPLLENLEMDRFYVKSLASSAVGRTMPIENTLRRLEILKLYGIRLDRAGEMRVVICLMSPPRIRKVTIELNSTGNFVQSQKYHKVRGVFCFRQLQEIQLGISSGFTAELKFIKLLLARSMVLEKMVVKPDPGRVFDGGLKILRELTEFVRVSPKAKVTYKDPDLIEVGGRKF